jgi:hypothetical protein
MNQPLLRARLSEMPRDGTTDLSPGRARCPGPSVQEIIRGDEHPAPAVLAHEHDAFLGADDIPVSRHTSPEFFKREITRLWNRTWQGACRDEQMKAGCPSTPTQAAGLTSFGRPESRSASRRR